MSNTIKFLSIWKSNTYKVLKLMVKNKQNTALTTFQTQIRKIEHKYLTRFSQRRFLENQLEYIHTKSSILLEGLRL